MECASALGVFLCSRKNFAVWEPSIFIIMMMIIIAAGFLIRRSASRAFSCPTKKPMIRNRLRHFGLEFQRTSHLKKMFSLPGREQREGGGGERGGRERERGGGGRERGGRERASETETERQRGGRQTDRQTE